MPIRKTSKGWYWGSKGPFKTREKAVQVAQAAYASGYKKEENEMKIRKTDLKNVVKEVISEEKIDEKAVDQLSKAISSLHAANKIIQKINPDAYKMNSKKIIKAIDYIAEIISSLRN